LGGLGQISSGEQRAGFGHGDHLVPHRVRLAGGPQFHRPAAQVQVKPALVADVRDGDAHAFQLPGDRVTKPLELRRVAGASVGEVARLVAVHDVGRLAGEHVCAERVLRMEVGRGEVQPSPMGELFGPGQDAPAFFGPIPLSTTRTARSPPISPMLGTNPSPWSGMITKSAAICWTSSVRTIGSGGTGAAMSVPLVTVADAA